MSTSKLKVIGDILEIMASRCGELNDLYGNDQTAAAQEWIEDISRFSNFGGRARNATLRDEVLLIASNVLGER